MFENDKNKESAIATCIKNLTSKKVGPSNASFVRREVYQK